MATAELFSLFVLALFENIKFYMVYFRRAQMWMPSISFQPTSNTSRSSLILSPFYTQRVRRPEGICINSRVRFRVFHARVAWCIHGGGGREIWNFNLRLKLMETRTSGQRRNDCAHQRDQSLSVHLPRLSRDKLLHWPGGTLIYIYLN